MNTRTYKVLAADDEYWSRETLRHLLDWGAYGMEFLEPALDGEEVLERIPTDRPDILLTDINMPFVNGLELLEEISEKYPSLITLAISGYDDFKKVKGVFLSGGIDYLLKPVSKEDLIAAMTKALEILEERSAKELKDQEIAKQQHQLSSYLEDSEYSALLAKKLYGSNAKQHHMSTRSFTEVSMVLVKFYDIVDISFRYAQDANYMSWSIKKRLRELLGTTNTALVFNNCNKMTEFLVAAQVGTRTLERFADRILNAFPLEEYGPVAVVLHEQTSSLDEIGAVYREMIAALMNRPFSRTSCILRCSNAAEGGLSKLAGAEARLEEELAHLIGTGQKSGAKRLIFETSDFEHCDRSGWTYLDVRQYVGRVTNLLYSYAHGKLPEQVSQMEESMENIDYYLKCLDAKELLSSLHILLNSLFEGEQEGTTATVGDQIELIRAYIAANYFETITLTALSEKYHVDASYLSRTFSKTYGETITAFLTRVRLEHALELMKEPARKLETISMLVGYDDYNYFSRVFRKKIGVSPSEHRASLAV